MDSDVENLVAKASSFERVLERRLNRFRPPLIAEERKAITDAVMESASDPFGDGVQDPVIDPTSVQFCNLKETDALAAEKFVHNAIRGFRNALHTGLDILDVLDKNTSSLNSARYWFPALCLVGGIDGVRGCIEQAKDLVRAGDPHALKHLLERRETMRRFSPLHFCCYGAVLHDLRMLMTAFPTDIGTVGKFKEVVVELCNAGARVDARDIAGFTPLGLAAGVAASSVSVALLPTLVEYGAEPNLKTRFGEPLLMESVWTRNVGAFNGMLDVGADLNGTDTMGRTVRQRAMMRPSIKVAMEMRRLSRLVMEKDKCEVCGKAESKKRCGSCQKAVYCSRACQVQGWKTGHKQACGKT